MDYDGVARPGGKGYDIGAYEYHEGGPEPEPDPDSDPDPDPDPDSHGFEASGCTLTSQRCLSSLVWLLVLGVVLVTRRRLRSR